MKRVMLVLLTALVSGCAKEKLSPLERVDGLVAAYGSLDAHFCTSAPAPAPQEIKYLILMDHSGSNQPGFPLVAGDVTNTDATGGRRYGPLVQFVQNMSVIPEVKTSFAIVDFSDDAAQPDDEEGFEPQNDFLATLKKDWQGNGTAANPAPKDFGFTNYKGALTQALEVIHDDAQLQVVSQNPVRSTYVIILVSDGVPTVANPAGTPATITQDFNQDLHPVLQSILDLKNDPVVGSEIVSVTLNTSYYHNDVQDPNARTLLQQLANSGNGQFSEFASGQNLLYQQFVPPQTILQHQFADVFIENLNATWWEGRLMQDTDGDGLPDAIEIALGSDPTQVDSDGNGVSDYIEYRTKGQPCADNQCLAANRFPYSVCAGFSPTTDAGGNVHFATTANDGLNDCEKYLIQADHTVFNSNGDLIPDFFAFKNDLAVSPTSAPAAFADPFGNGLSNVAKIKAGLPTQVSTKSLGPFQSRSITVTQEASPSPDTACYHLTADHIALTSSDNRVRVTFVQNSSGVQNKPFSMIAEKSFTADERSVSFLPAEFH